ncbi:glycosyltransferase family 4 protein [Arcticibacterium luteifluviistationis]|uniref:Glycosyl transferase family 1 n=1 Tax=Arcticibacterium luteifluviistationis TaxID=1784714 RepID=A0A2Z4GA66_9BACT|nr:glycosyltransferase family 1 protein [Arcticibacterium luteifluviistationis]AWV98044.1 glycosyl transferase family 1 [Arcticibacterium luteifluviistationis]
MKLIFDLTKTQPINGAKFHGGGKYGEIVFKALIKKSPNIIAYYNSKNWLNPLIKSACSDYNILMIDCNNLTLKTAAKEHKAVIYSPILEKDISIIGEDITYIATIHGLRVLEMPFDKYKVAYKETKFSFPYHFHYQWKAKSEFNSARERYRKILKQNNLHFITVSEHSKGSLLSFIPSLKEEQLQVFYSPSTIESSLATSIEKNREKYYLLVSGNRWIKNSIRALKAFDEIFSERPNFEGKVIVTGIKQPKILQKQIKNHSRFEFLDYVEESMLRSLYRDAYLFVYPSLNEGFGYPPLEAMAQGTPVIASAIASIPEVCGEAALYFNPLITSEIKMRILQMENENTRKRFMSKALNQSNVIQKKQQEDLDRFSEYLLSFIQKNDTITKNSK